MKIEEPKKITCEFITPSLSIEKITVEIPLTWYYHQITRAYMFFNSKNYLRVYKEKKLEFMILGVRLDEFTTLNEHIDQYVR